MPPKLAGFLDDVFAKDGRRHTLALGELHELAGHKQWLMDHVDALKAHGVTCIGMELPTFMNPFLWAYADGSLARELGSTDAARDYLVSVWQARNHSNYGDADLTGIHMLTKMMDQGMQVACYDARDSLAYYRRHVAKQLAKYPRLAVLAEQQGWAEREDPNRTGRELVELKHASHSPDYDKQHQTHALAADMWVLHELDHLLQTHPKYQKRIDAFERAIAVGHDLIHARTIGSDGLSACMMHALMPKKGNCIVISGLLHNAGAPDKSRGKHPVEYVHGLFTHHLQAIVENTGVLADGYHPRNHRICSAILSDEQMLKRYQDKTAAIDRSKQHVAVSIPIIDLQEGSLEGTFPGNNKPSRKLLSDEEAYRHHSGLVFSLVEEKNFSATMMRNMNDHRARRFENPALIPELKKACDAVQATMHGEPQRAR